jgi:thiol-disulfide isomerase/thioredoxin
MLAQCFLILALSVAPTAAAGNQASTAEATARISGCVRAPDGKAAPGIPVECFYFSQRGSDVPYQRARQDTDENGRYEFQVPGGFEHYVNVPPRRSTGARSNQFDVRAGQEVHVEDLIVRPAMASLKGRVVRDDGRPAAGFEFFCRSENFTPFVIRDYSKTDSNGLFNIPHVLPDEEITFWVVPEPNHIQAWTGIGPTTFFVEFRLDPREYEEMPPEWRKYWDDDASARHAAETRVQKRIDMTLPDLAGGQVSLSSERFKGKVVLVNIFGSWCGVCRLEIPHLVALEEKHRAAGLEIVGVAFEREPGQAGRAALKALIEKSRINYPVLFGGSSDDANVLSTIKGIERFAGYPTTILIGRDSQVKSTDVGFKHETKERVAWWNARIEKQVTDLLKEPK